MTSLADRPVTGAAEYERLLAEGAGAREVLALLTEEAQPLYTIWKRADQSDQARRHGSVCVSGCCLAHRQQVYWNIQQDCWVHVGGSWPCEALAGAAKLDQWGRTR